MSDGTSKEPDIINHRSSLSQVFGDEWLNQHQKDYKILGHQHPKAAPEEIINPVGETAQLPPKRPFWKRSPA